MLLVLLYTSQFGQYQSVLRNFSKLIWFKPIHCAWLPLSTLFALDHWFSIIGQPADTKKNRQLCLSCSFVEFLFLETELSPHYLPCHYYLPQCSALGFLGGVATASLRGGFCSISIASWIEMVCFVKRTPSSMLSCLKPHAVCAERP